MSDLHSLIRACKAEPDDDAPRLVLSDWLEEHGEEERAKFIRFQLANRDADERSCPSNPQWLAEWKRWADQWMLTNEHSSYPAHFVRGFIWVADCYSELYEQLATILAPAYDWTWLERIYFGSWHNGDWTPLFRSSQLLELNRLEFGDDKCNSVLVSPLAESSFVKNLLHLNLSHVTVTDQGADHLSQARHLAGLRILNLVLAHIGPVGARAIAQSQAWDRLRSFSLRVNPLEDKGLIELASGRPRPVLESLDIAHCNCTDDGLVEFAKSDRFPKLRRLYVGRDSRSPVFGAKGLEALLNSKCFQKTEIHFNLVFESPPEGIEELEREFHGRFFYRRVAPFPSPPPIT